MVLLDGMIVSSNGVAVKSNSNSSGPDGNMLMLNKSINLLPSLNSGLGLIYLHAKLNFIGLS